MNNESIDIMEMTASDLINLLVTAIAELSLQGRFVGIKYNDILNHLVRIQTITQARNRVAKELMSITEGADNVS